MSMGCLNKCSSPLLVEWAEEETGPSLTVIGTSRVRGEPQAAGPTFLWLNFWWSTKDGLTAKLRGSVCFCLLSPSVVTFFPLSFLCNLLGTLFLEPKEGSITPPSGKFGLVTFIGGWVGVEWIGETGLGPVGVAVEWLWGGCVEFEVEPVPPLKPALSEFSYGKLILS